MLGSSAHRLPRGGVLAFLCLVGILFSCVALYQHVVYSHGLASGPSFCNISRHINCEAVNTSPWSVFFGIPVAAYGLFFYVALLGITLLAGRWVSAHKAHEVILFSSLVASVVSLLLFAISEFVIGALCIMCIGLYLTNFLLLGVSWWSATGGTLLGGVFGGVQNIFECVVQAATGSWRALVGLVVLVAWAVVSAASPDLLLKIIPNKKSDRGDESPATIVQGWRAASVVIPNLNTAGGAFTDYAKGEDENAPIQIVEFADFECPGCRRMSVALGELLEKYKGHYRLVFKNYPLDSVCNRNIHHEFHRSACFAAYVTRCAGEQGKFWEALDVVFTDPILEGKREDIAKDHETLLGNVASELGLDREALKECVDSGRYKSKMADDVIEGDRLGLSSTPFFVVNGKPVSGVSPRKLSAIFDAVLFDAGVVQTPTVSNEAR